MIFNQKDSRDSTYGFRDMLTFLRDTATAIADDAATAVSQRNIRLLYRLYYQGLLNDYSIEIVPLGYLKVDTFEKVQLVARLILLDNLDEFGRIILRNIEPLSDRWQNILNRTVAPMFIERLYLYPVTQNRLFFKETDSSDISEEDREIYEYLRENAEILFEYLSVPEILSLLNVSFPQLILARLRRNHRDTRTLSEILQQDYRGQTLDSLYGNDLKEGNHRLLWRLLFS
jgi:hypothetical protein